MYKLLVLVLLASCTSAVEDEYGTARSLTVRFEGGKLVETANGDAIRKLAQFVGSADTVNASGCTENGLLNFGMPDGNTRPVSFAISDTCRYFFIESSGRRQIREMSNEAYDFLTALRLGQKTY